MVVVVVVVRESYYLLPTGWLAGLAGYRLSAVVHWDLTRLTFLTATGRRSDPDFLGCGHRISVLTGRESPQLASAWCDSAASAPLTGGWRTGARSPGGWARQIQRILLASITE